MAEAQFISINEAAELVGKSQQTIRRVIKAKKVDSRREKTPQGFNYFIGKASLLSYYGVSESAAPAEQAVEQRSVPAVKLGNAEDFKQLLAEREHKVMVEYAPVAEFNKTLQALIQQHAREKENLFQLVEAFQNKVVTLETKLHGQDEQSDKPWYRFW